ncbi:craniofacial development protein 2-like [Adelges cooleyi]|uniref:craniofacial development protein 2-like n=1 Tax=Adelges cooleyi TaxID=133065 RepID=UPI0021809A5C|nr:craniofacial development protein 2-like [Adelges cooleyi]
MDCHDQRNTYSTDHGIRKPRSGRGRIKASSVVIQRNPCSSFRIGTWNIRTALKPGKIEEIKDQMKHTYIDIFGICETRWGGNGDYITEDFRVIHSGNDKSGRNGVAIIVQGKWKNNIINTYHLNDRILVVKIHAQPTNIYIIQVYFPTTNSQDVEIEEMYEQIEVLMKLTDDKANVIIMGDFNASVGKQDSSSNCLGKFGLGKQNERGARLVQFCEQLELTISNTFFQVPKRRRYTWKAPIDIRRSQIDFILVKQKYRNQVRSSHSYPGCDIDRNHNLVLAKCNIIFKKSAKRPIKKWCLDKLKSSTTVDIFKKVLENKEAKSWEELKSVIKETSDRVLGKNTLQPRKPWMSQDILELIKERNFWRNKDYDKYKHLRNKIIQKCRQAKEKWMEEYSEDIEMMMKRNNNGVYAKVKKLQYTPKTRSNIVKNKAGKILFDNDEVANRWKEYLEDLYIGEDINNKQEEYIKNEQNLNPAMKGPEITKDEFNRAIRDLSDKKSTGLDDIPSEILKNLDEKNKESPI